jgi:hypothetical protein
MNNYPHMCRDGHVEIGHADNSFEMCPLCRETSRVEALEKAVMTLFMSHCLNTGHNENQRCPICVHAMAALEATK